MKKLIMENVNRLGIMTVCVFTFVMCSSNHQDEYYDSGSLKATSQYQHGKRNGPASGYYESGNLRFTCSYQNNVMTGWMIYYRDSTAKILKEKRLYNDSGRLIYLKTFDNEGKMVYNQVMPFILTSKDTVDIDEAVDITLNFGIDIPQTTAFFGIAGEHFTLKDTVEIRKIEGAKSFKFNYHSNRPGRTTLGFLFENNVATGDSTNLK